MSDVGFEGVENNDDLQAIMLIVGISN